MPEPDAMPPDPPAPVPEPVAPPAWLDATTLHAMRVARDRRLAAGEDAEAAAQAAREVVRAHYPALPLRMLAEAVAAVTQPPRERPAAPVRTQEGTGSPSRPATLDLAGRLFHALRAAEGRRTGIAETAPPSGTADVNRASPTVTASAGGRAVHAPWPVTAP
jgi:hypothetical protein